MHDRESLLAALDNSHKLIRDLVLSLTPEQRSVPFHPGINPPVWEWGHSAFFYEVFILRDLDHIDPMMPGMDPIWDSFDIDHPDRWVEGVVPSLECTEDYVNDVYQRVRNRIENAPLNDADLYRYKYSIFHQHMHIESLVWCRQTLGYPAPSGFKLHNPDTQQSNLPVQEDVAIPGGDYRIGRPGQSANFATDDFAFDAEKPAFTKTIHPFSISKTLVSNGEFLQFVEDGGYLRPELWSFGGQKWLKQLRQSDPDIANVAEKAIPPGPIYWRQHEGQWQHRLFDRWLALNPAAPVCHISYWEAEAWCQWAGRRLPTEYEWEAAALGNRMTEGTHPDQQFNPYPWGSQMDAGRVDMDRQHFAQLAVDELEKGTGPFGLHQTIGTVWEWTSSQFLPYDGFTKDMYPYMSTLQFGYHKVLRGGSCATSSNLIRGTYRQAYLPFRRDVFTGFRSCPLL